MNLILVSLVIGLALFTLLVLTWPAPREDRHHTPRKTR